MESEASSRIRPEGWNKGTDVPFSHLNARERAAAICDPGSFQELLAPVDRFVSPHLPQMGQVPQFDDGTVIGLGRLGPRRLVIVSQDGRFLGGGIGEVNGTKMLMAIRLAVETYDRLMEQGDWARAESLAVVISFDTGGVRLQEANAGLLAHSEIMDQLENARSRLPVIGVVGGHVGCFGGMAFVAASTDALIISETGRLGLTGPAVIEEVFGPKEFDSANRALVWRTTGGRHRYITRDAAVLVEDSAGAFRDAVAALLSLSIHEIRAYRVIGSLQHVLAQKSLVKLAADLGIRDSHALWRAIGNDDPEALAEKPLPDFLQTVRRLNLPVQWGENGGY
jgi:biotin-independent malonate decarboxylase beta subunit